jgi:predicted  nucleic acid-binding Zn-ribbon protein
MLRHVQQPTLTDSPDEQVTALKDTIANQQTRLANLQGRLATSLNDKEKLQAQLLTAERRILELESESGWS